MRFLKTYKKYIFIAGAFLFLFAGQNAMAANSGEAATFNVDKNFDASDRTQVAAVLVKTSPKLYFYVEKLWWDLQSSAKRDQILIGFDGLSVEFDNKIYPILTSVFGSEWKPGVDGDERITILFQAMKEDAGGYFRTADEYIKLQLPDSNEKEMVYLNISRIEDSQLKMFLAHELTHLITFNQKEKKFDVQEEVWLDEARAEYVSTILGYDDQYDGSNLQRRVRAFVENPSDSLTEWQNKKYDYGAVNIFFHYLVDHFSVGVLIDSLKSKYIGIESLNYALQKMGYEEDFSQIFTDWTLAVVLNDCSLGNRYCYLDKNLKNLRIAPSLNFLPLTGNVSLSVTNVTKNWTGNWLKFIGGNGDLALDFSSLTGLNFAVPYIIEDSKNNYEIKYLALDENQKNKIDIKNFGKDYKSLIIIPSLQSKISNFDGLEFTYPYTYSVQIKGEMPADEQALIRQLLDRIAYLKAEIAKILAQRGGGVGQYCYQINNNLYPGMTNNNEVKCLQQFLKGQGMYTGNVTGNYASLTRAAVVSFQEKYLVPSPLPKATGNTGPTTRIKINSFLISQ